MTDLVRSLRGDAVQPFGAYLFRATNPAPSLAATSNAPCSSKPSATPRLLAEEYGPYEASSVFICVVDQLRELPVGIMRVLLPSAEGFKSLNDLRRYGATRRAAGRPQRRGVRPRPHVGHSHTRGGPEYRGAATHGLVSMGLYQTLTLAARRCGVDWFVAILDLPVFRMIRWKLRMIFAGYEGVGPKPYLGSAASMPAWCDVVDAERHLAATDRDLHAILVQGVGLEAALRPVDLACTDQLVGWRRTVAAGQ